jgi:proteasome alpha subunit
MQPAQHQLMGYDRAITMFSPDGRLLQVEYAKKTVKQGSCALGIVCKDGVVLASDKRILDPLIIPESVEKIFKLDEHLGTTVAGILSDARVLVERAQVKAQQHKMSYSTPIDVLTIVKDICTLKQVCTQSGGLRPFGVSLLIGGMDEEGFSLFETDPTGIFFQYEARAIGDGEAEVEEVLHKEYKKNMSIDDGLKLAAKALKKVLDDKVDVKRLDVVAVTEKGYHKLSDDEVKTLFGGKK